MSSRRRSPSPFILGLAGLCLMLASESAQADCVCPASSVVVMGHRGTGTHGPQNPWPENTLPAFEQGVAEGAEMIELDVQHTSDGVLIVLHDDTVDRTTDGTGCAGDLSLAELQAFDAAEGTPLAGTAVTIPTFAEVLAAVDVGVNVEIKVHDGGNCPPSDRAQLAFDVVAAIHADTKDRPIVVSSFDADVLSEVKALDSTAQVGLLTLADADLAVATSRGFDALNLFHLGITAAVADEVHAAGLMLNAWTVDDTPQITKMLGLCDGIISDEPDLVASLRADACAALCAAEPSASSSGCTLGNRADGAGLGTWLGALGLLALRWGRRRA